LQNLGTKHARTLLNYPDLFLGNILIWGIPGTGGGKAYGGSRQKDPNFGSAVHTASAAIVASFFFYRSIYDSDYFTAVSQNGFRLLVGVFVLLCGTGLVVRIPIAIYPLLKKYVRS
jgi:hypothetical protein